MSTNEQIADVFNQETKFFGETDRENYDRKESSMTYKKIADNMERWKVVLPGCMRSTVALMSQRLLQCPFKNWDVINL